jgi:L-ascorbate metabolism protein UlaG (beta-lactamase superfamily)
MVRFVKPMSKTPQTPHPVRIELSRRAFNRSLAALPLALTSCAGESAEGMAGQPWHHTTGGFRNPPGSLPRGGDFGDWTSFFMRRFGPAEAPAVPDGHVLPPDEVMAGLQRQNGPDSLTWLGHASFLIRLDGRTILTDPFLSDHASPVPPLGPERFAPPGLTPAQLPPIDILLLSHNHYDHLDLPTIEALPAKEHIQVLAPLRLGHYFTSRGFSGVRELDWHDQMVVAGIEVTGLPAIHFSKRTLFDRNQTLWGGYAVQSSRKRLLFAGDTGYGPIFPQLGRNARPFDAALLPIGAYEPRLLMRAVHVNPEEAVQIGRDLNARRLVAMHWGTIQLTEEPPFEPPERFRAAAHAAGYGDDQVWVLRIGETRVL